MPMKQADSLYLVENEFSEGKMCELAFLYVHEAALWLEGWFYHSEFSGYYLFFNHIGYFGIGFYFFSLNGKL